jgi:stage II sporulation protein GA (sporulation sigma-E factor processing peptidase)
MPGHVIYLDQIILGNWLVNYLLLWFVARLTGAPVRHPRLAAAAALGAGYLLVVWWPGGGYFFSFPAKLVLSGLMVLVGLAPDNLRRFALQLMGLYLVAFGLGGLILGLEFLLEGQTPLRAAGGVAVFAGRSFWPAVVLALAILLVLGRWGGAYWRRRLFPMIFQVPLVLRFFGREVRVEALLDTGNQLTDPLGDYPVIVVESGALTGVLPPAVAQALAREELVPGDLLRGLAGTAWASRLRVIPYSSLGCRHGLLIGFRPDEVVVYWGARPLRVKEVVVGVYHRALSPGHGYRALIHPRVLEGSLV